MRDDVRSFSQHTAHTRWGEAERSVGARLNLTALLTVCLRTAAAPLALSLTHTAHTPALPHLLTVWDQPALNLAAVLFVESPRERSLTSHCLCVVYGAAHLLHA
jgi:hypothetical protein